MECNTVARRWRSTESTSLKKTDGPARQSYSSGKRFSGGFGGWSGETRKERSTRFADRTGV